MPFELPEDRRTARRSAITRWVSFTLVAILVGLMAYLGYVGFAGSDQLANPPHSADCRTPAIGWVYEAVNYDPASDATLADLPDPRECPARRTSAGHAVRSSDDIGIAAWYIPAGDGSPPRGATVVLAHGYGGNKSNMLDVAELLHDRYNLVLFDFRNHGQSGGTQTTQGLLEKNDLRAVIAWLEREKNPGRLAVLGVSMGGASALNEAVDDANVDAVILDSTHATLANAIQARLERQGYPLSLPGAWAILLGGLIRTGQDMSAVDPIQMVRGYDRPLLIIVGGRDDAIGSHDGQDLLAAAKDGRAPSAELEVCARANHGQAISHCRADYRDWVLGFLQRSLAP